MVCCVSCGAVFCLQEMYYSEHSDTARSLPAGAELPGDVRPCAACGEHNGFRLLVGPLFVPRLQTTNPGPDREVRSWECILALWLLPVAVPIALVVVATGFCVTTFKAVFRALSWCEDLFEEGWPPKCDECAAEIKRVERLRKVRP